MQPFGAAATGPIARAREGPAGRSWHAVADEGIPLREIAEALGRHPGFPAMSIPAEVRMLPDYVGFLANLVTLDVPASNAITRKVLGWEPSQPGLIADLGNGHYFRPTGPASTAPPAA